MSAEQEIATPVSLARLEFVSPWQTPHRASAIRRWPAWLADAWREGMTLYVRAAMPRGRWQGWP